MEMSKWSAMGMEVPINSAVKKSFLDSATDFHDDIEALMKPPKSVVEDNTTNDSFEAGLHHMFQHKNKKDEEEQFCKVSHTTNSDVDIQVRIPHYFKYGEKNPVIFTVHDVIAIDFMSVKMNVLYFKKGDDMPKTTDEKTTQEYYGLEHNVTIHKMEPYAEDNNVLHLQIHITHEKGDKMYHEVICIFMEEYQGRFPFLHEVTQQPNSERMYWVECPNEDIFDF